MRPEWWEQICQDCQLGHLLEDPKRLTGGLLHRMYMLRTDCGQYAVKLLNPSVMQRETAHANYAQAEKLERMLEVCQLPIVPARIFHQEKMQCHEGQYYYVFDWYAGKALMPQEVQIKHCEKIAGILAQIHQLETKVQASEPVSLHIDWDREISSLAQKHPELGKLLKAKRDLLVESQEKGNAAHTKLPSYMAVCHRDLDCKNVLWNQDDFRIIDLECLAYANPMTELYETALYWSGYDCACIQPALLQAFVKAYAQSGGKLPLDWEVLYDSFTEPLDWLAYNMRRAQGIDGHLEEVSIGIAEVKSTLKKIVAYYESKEEILNRLYAMNVNRGINQLRNKVCGKL